METPYDIQERTFVFACRIVTFCRFLSRAEPVTRRLSWQLLDAGTSVGANLEEADAGQTKRDFIAKTSIARKECREAHFWLRLISFAEPECQRRMSPLVRECDELIAILTTIIKNAESNAGRGQAPPGDSVAL